MALVQFSRYLVISCSVDEYLIIATLRSLLKLARSWYCFGMGLFMHYYSLRDTGYVVVYSWLTWNRRSPWLAVSVGYCELSLSDT